MKKPDQKANAPVPASRSSNLLDNRMVVGVISVALAFFLWSLVTMVFDPSSNVTRDGVVNYSYDSSKYTSLGLDIVEKTDAASVRVKFEGNGTIIGGISTNDFIVYPNYSTLKGAGTATLQLQVKITNAAYSSGVTATVENPRYIDVVFDKVSEKTVPVTVEPSGIQVADNYVLSKTSSVPAEVTLTGPTSELDTITSVVAPVTVDGVLTDSRTLTSLLEMRNASGGKVTPEYVTMDNDAASVTMTVYEVRELPLTIDFINTPISFDTSSLKYTLSQQTLKIQGPAKTVDVLSSLSVANFDLGQSFALGRDYQLPVELPAGLQAQDGISTVTLSFDTSGMGTTTLNVANIRTVNVPTNYDIKVLTDRIKGVTLYGPADEIASLSADSVVAQIDCQSISVSAGQQTMPVSIQIPSSTHIFATGSYTVQCQVTGK